jgi:hypothetical protein
MFTPVCGAEGDFEDPALQEKLKLFQRFEANLARPLTERVQAMPQDFLQSIADYDKSIGIRNTDYKAHALSPAEMTMFAEYIKLLPEKYQTTFSSKLLAVYFIDNFAGAGLTDWVVDKDGKFYYYVILNSALLEQSLDEWLTYRENSFFTPGSPLSIQIRTGTSYKALMYGFLHEGGHIVDMEYHVTPYLDAAHKKTINQQTEVSDFTRSVWESQKTPVAEYRFNNQDRLNVYGIFDRALVPASEMEIMFNQLGKTPFVSFYSGTAWYEDFADLVTYRYIDKKLGGSISMELYEDGRLLKKRLPAKLKIRGDRKRIIKEFIK